MASSLSLFECCVQCILRSLYLLRRTPLHLPQRISHYLLYEACKTRNVVAVQNLIEMWPYSNLSFDFLSNPLCRRKKEASSSCLEPHEYYGIFCTDEFAQCFLSIAVGVFHNTHHCLCDHKPTMNFVDVSDIMIAEATHVDILCKLVCGEFPGRHTSDYLSAEDLVKVRGRPRPHLTHVCKPASRTKLYMNISIQSPSMLEKVLKSSAESKWFQLILKGLDLTLLGPKYVISALQNLDLSELQDLHVSTFSDTAARVCLHSVLSALPQPLTLWVFNRVGILPILQSVCSLRGLLVTSNSAPVFDDLAKANSNVKVLAVLNASSVGLSDYIKKVTACLQSVSKSLEYLQLRSCLLSVVFTAAQMCSHLRVLSVSHTGNSHTSSTQFSRPNLSNVFAALGLLSCLEFLEWTESLNMQTKDILSLHTLLHDALPKLRHWHMNLPYLLLFTTDLDKQDYGPIMPLLLSLLEGKTGDESCVTYKFSFESEAFKTWLCSLRLDVCFRRGKCASQLHFMY